MRYVLFLGAVAAAFLLFASTQKSPQAASQNEEKASQTDLSMTSRFILLDDPHCDTVAGIPLPQNWWSRHHEYQWAAQFAGPEYVVLDAACGIPHPFKWYLGKTCRTTWACDIDWKINCDDKILEQIKSDLGEEAFSVASKTLYPWNNVHFVRASITSLPDSMPLFDRIFCISTLERMKGEDCQKALMQFARKLAPGGLVVITADYPAITPEELLSRASQAGLVPADTAIVGEPPKEALFNESLGLYIYRCVLKKKA